jgi:arginyl-tRNA synthetase
MRQNADNGVPIVETLSVWIRSVFEKIFGSSEHDFSGVRVAATANPEFGDYQCNDAMSLARILKKSPREIAQAVTDAAELHDSLDRIEVAGPGFINMYLKPDWVAAHLEEMMTDENLGVPAVGRGQTIMMDYGGPNMCKSLHIGHLRSPNIGSALDRMLRLLGYKVVSDSHLGDWGTQFGIIIMGYREFGDKEAMERKPMEELERVYVESYERSRSDGQWLEKCRQELVSLQSGDEENLRLWEHFMDLTGHEVSRIYARLGFSFDLVRGESHYRDKLENVVTVLKDKGIIRESEGALVALLDDDILSPAIVQKSDGGYNYTTTDVATIMNRVEEFDPDKILYITDERQQLHFKQVFAICRELGYELRLDHVWFGLMRLPEGTFSTREGKVISLESLLDEAESRALDIVKDSSPDMPADQQREVARAVGIGAVKYADLSQNPQSLVVFTWDKALALDGNSGPYLQYACARISSVKDKYSERFPGKDPEAYPIKLASPLERDLALKLVRFSEILVRAAESCKPSTLADYLYDLAQTYSTFYQNVPFLKAEEGVRESRVRLCGMVAKVLRKGLDLLGIETPERI